MSEIVQKIKAIEREQAARAERDDLARYNRGKVHRTQLA